MTHESQHEKCPVEHFSCKSFQYKDIRPLSYSSLHVGSAKRVGERLRTLRQQRRLSQKALGEMVGSDGPRIHRIEKGLENPTLETLDKLARALVVDITDVFGARPEAEAGHATDRAAAVHDHPRLERLIASVDSDFPAEDSVEGDIHKAIAALNRALRRPRTSATPDRPAQKIGR